MLSERLAALDLRLADLAGQVSEAAWREIRQARAELADVRDLAVGLEQFARPVPAAELKKEVEYGPQ